MKYWIIAAALLVAGCDVPNKKDREQETKDLIAHVRERCEKEYPKSYSEYDACTKGSVIYNQGLPWKERR